MIQPATPADLDSIVSLVNSAYRGDSSRTGWTTEADYLDGQRTDPEILSRQLQSGTILCLRSNAELQGCVYVEIQSDECYLGMLTVRPNLQNSGCGKRLMAAAEEFALAHGANKMRIQVLHMRDSLIAWYQRHGYVATGETKPFSYGDERFGLPKRPDLYFNVYTKSLISER